jgi:hypothetical protein
MLSNFLYEIIGPHAATHFPANCNRRPDVLGTAFMRTSALPIYIEPVEALSSDHNPVILVVNVEPHETTLPRMNPFTVNWASSRQLLKQTILNPNIALVEEIDTAITTFISTIKSAKKLSHIPA